MIERINKLNRIEKIKTVIKELMIEIKFNELGNNLDIRLLKLYSSAKTIFLILQNILAMEKILK